MTGNVLNERVNKYLKTLNASFPDYWSHANSGRRILLRIAEILHERESLQLLVIETPVNPLIQPLLPPYYFDQYKTQITRFFDQQGISYFDPTESSNLNPQDFTDVVHLFEPEAIERFTHSISNYLQEFVL